MIMLKQSAKCDECRTSKYPFCFPSDIAIFAMDDYCIHHCSILIDNFISHSHVYRVIDNLPDVHYFVIELSYELYSLTQIHLAHSMNK